jgi:ribosome biogenesis GTPase
MAFSGRIIEKRKNNYIVDSAQGCFEATLKGTLKNARFKPCAGDMVQLEMINPDPPQAMVIKLDRRKNLLLRPVVANLDQIFFIVTLREPAVDSCIIDRFLFNAQHNEIDVVIVFNKTDLLTEEQLPLLQQMCTTYQNVGYPVLSLCAATGEGVAQLTEIMRDKLSTFAGVSGVGKSTILNRLMPGINLPTRTLSAHIERGVHTTTQTTLMKLPGGGYIADTPGFAWIDIPYVAQDDVALLFPELKQAVGSCRFNNCLHINEPDCAVKAHVESGQIASSRYHNYLDFYELMATHKDRYRSG